ncbi:MAG: hypothetical protein KJO82_13660, partial [Gammaproteobacteria bacterium]|nr:hypothetical protein [Gammaproteobacteria bacterium]
MNVKRCQTNTRFILVAALLALVSGCASQGTATPPGAGIEAEFTPAANRSTGNLAERRGAAIAQGGVLLARSFPIDPINRPVSNVLSLSSYTLKSATGFLQRLAIGTAQFPSLETRRIPPLSASQTMDLDQWERDLDRMIGRKSSRGEIRILVDGDEYFGRLEAAFRNATESIDIRTHIFDNDDYA